MNPDKLFDYLDGKLPDHERKAVEERLMSDPTARREFDVARRIHGFKFAPVLGGIIADAVEGKVNPKFRWRPEVKAGAAKEAARFQGEL